MTPHKVRNIDTTNFIEDAAPDTHNIAVLLQFQVELIKESTATLIEIKELLIAQQNQMAAVQPYPRC